MIPYIDIYWCRISIKLYRYNCNYGNRWLRRLTTAVTSPVLLSHKAMILYEVDTCEFYCLHVESPSVDERHKSSEEANGNKKIAIANAISTGAMNGRPVPTET
jgi:hypothetical protein